MQNVQSADGVQLFFRGMQPGDWARARWRVAAKTAQVHSEAQARLPRGFRDRIALPLLVLACRDWRQHQIGRLRASESLGERGRIGDVRGERNCSLTNKALQPFRVAPNDAYFLALRQQEITDDRAGVPGRA